MPRRSQKFIFTGLILVFGCMVFVVLVLLGSISEQRTNTEEMTRSREAVHKLATLEHRLGDAENGKRGYLISGETRFLESHRAAAEDVHRLLEELQEVATRRDDLTNTLSELTDLIRDRLELAAESLRAREQQGFDPAAQSEFLLEGQAKMDAIRPMLRELATNETERLQEEQELRDKHVRDMQGLAVLLCLLCMGVFMVLVSLFVQAVRRQRMAEEVLRKSNLELDERVRERTGELTRTVEELQRAAEANRESERRFRQISEWLPQLVWTADPNGQIDYLSTRWLEFVGGSMEDHLGSRWFASLHPDDRDRVMRLWATAIAAGSDLRIELRLRRNDGEYRWFDTRAVPLRGSDGAITKWFGSNTDITDRKQFDQRLQAELMRLDLLSRITRAIGERQDLRSILQVVLQNIEDHFTVEFTCVLQYDEVEKALQLACIGRRSESVGRRMGITQDARIPIDDNGMSRALRGRLIYEPDVTELSFPFCRRLSGGGLGAVVMAPVATQEKVFGLLITARRQPRSFASGECEFLRQLSEHVALAAQQATLYQALQKAYEDLRDTQQAVMQQERLRALGQMASGIAHDINNAIVPIALYAELLDQKEKGISPLGREQLRTIRRAIADVTQTVSRMREFYRQRDAQGQLGPVELNPLIDQVIELTRARWSDMPQQRGIVIKVRREFAPDLPPILGIEAEIREALTNLVFNAVDAMPEGGILTMRTSLVRGGEEERDRVCLEVVDSGVGMDERTRRQCLEPFFTTKGERGTGLGLAMVYGIVQRHGADLDIDSAPGAGTTVRIGLRVAKHPVPAHEPAPAPTGPMPHRVLVVDDDPLVAATLNHALQTDGHAVLVAQGGQEGIDHFRQALEGGEPFDLVITDLGMPHVDGRQVALAIKTASKSTPVILLTGWGQRLDAEGELPMHVDEVLSKPPSLVQLREAIARVAG